MSDFVSTWLLPPGVRRAVKRLTTRPVRASGKTDQAPAIDDSLTWQDSWQLFREAASESMHYAEYGVGSSTLYMAEQTEAQIHGVDTDFRWIDRVNAAVSRHVELSYVDLGPLKSWGRPRGYERDTAFQDYFERPFLLDRKADLVLVDGRFRVACFLTALIRVKPNTVIIFDDYVNREHYHVVERVLKPEAVNERQARFIRPARINAALTRDLIQKFSYVMD